MPVEIAVIAPQRSEVLGTNSETIKSIAPPLVLAILKRLTPSDVNVSAFDETVTPIDFDKHYDLVALSVATHTAPRAYQLADAFRAKGTRVVLGGIHVTALPEEAAQHADAVVLGEAELTWPQVLADLQAGRQLQQVYRSPKRPSPADLVTPDRSIFNPGSYVFPCSMYTTRGCPNGCGFCSVTSFFGGSYRSKPVEQVLQEVDALSEKLVFFVDDNIAGHRDRAQILFKNLRGKGLIWIGQASVSMARDESLLEAAAASGCLALFLGVESLLPENLLSVSKHCNKVEEYEEAIRRFHNHGIAVLTAFIFGMDHDTEDIFDLTVRFARRNKVDAAQFNILTPYPGTPLRATMERNGRITSNNWADYHADKAVIEPLHMSATRLEEGRNWAEREFFSKGSMWERLGLPTSKRDLAIWLLNLNYRKDRVSRAIVETGIPIARRYLFAA